MDAGLVLGAVQTVFSVLAVGIAAIQLRQQWPRSRIVVSLL
jgi:hypothetical protein